MCCKKKRLDNTLIIRKCKIFQKSVHYKYSIFIFTALMNYIITKNTFISEIFPNDVASSDNICLFGY